MAGNEERDSIYLGEIDIRAAASAGIAGAAAFLVVLLLFVALMGGNAMEPLSMIAAVVLGAEAMSPPLTFDIGILAAAIGVHVVLSLIYAFVLAAMLHNQSVAMGIGVGLAFGLLLYIVNFHFFTSLFPWFAEGRGWGGAFAHFAFGLTAGWTYVKAEVVAPKRRPLEERHA